MTTVETPHRAKAVFVILLVFLLRDMAKDASVLPTEMFLRRLLEGETRVVSLDVSAGATFTFLDAATSTTS